MQTSLQQHQSLACAPWYQVFSFRLAIRFNHHPATIPAAKLTVISLTVFCCVTMTQAPV